MDKVRTVTRNRGVVEPVELTQSDEGGVPLEPWSTLGLGGAPGRNRTDFADTMTEPARIAAAIHFIDPAVLIVEPSSRRSPIRMVAQVRVPPAGIEPAHAV